MLINEIAKIINVNNIPPSFTSLSIYNNNVNLYELSKVGNHYSKDVTRLGAPLSDEQVYEIEKLIRDTPGDTMNDDKYQFFKKFDTYVVAFLKPVGTPAINIFNADLSYLPWNNLVKLINEKSPFIIDEKEFIYSSSSGIQTEKSPFNSKELKFLHDHFHGISKDYFFSGKTITKEGNNPEYETVGIVNLFKGNVLIFTYNNGPKSIKHIAF